MKIVSARISGLLRILVFPFLCLQLSATTITMQAVADTSIFEANPDFNLGGTSLVSGTNRQYSRSRALFRFDLSSLPEGAVVTDVVVSLVVTRIPDVDQITPTNTDFNLYRVFVSWGEGTGSSASGTVAAAGDATWNARHYGTTPWGNPGALIGEDYSATASATTAVSGISGYTWGSTPELVEDVRAWLTDPASNFGFILVSDGEDLLASGRRFASTEQSDPNHPAPQLTVTYSLVPEPAVAALWLMSLAGIVFLRVRPR